MDGFGERGVAGCWCGVRCAGDVVTERVGLQEREAETEVWRREDRQGFYENVGDRFVASEVGIELIA